MGNYNPHAPYIIGQEWVPIRQANFEPDDGITERGYQFYLDHASPVVSGAYYVASPPPMGTFNVAEFISVYPAGTENETGPIKSLTIPVSAVGVTGTGISATVESLLNPSDGLVTGFTAGPGNTGTLGLSFDVTNYSQQLFGKRILDLQLAYTASGSIVGLATFQIWIRRLLSGNSLGYQTGLEGATSSNPQNEIHYVPFTDLNLYWAAGGGAIDGSLQPFVYPWRYPELANFAANAVASNRLIVYVTAGLSSLTAFTDDCSIGYAALQVTYCEEKRVLYGGDRINFSTGGNFYPPTPTGKLIMLRTTDLSIPTTLPAGQYTVVENHRKIASTFVATSPNLFALRELYQLPHQRGININRSLTLDETFTTSNSDVLPHVTLHTASAVVTGVHAYGTQNDIPVYGSITAIQEIEDDPVGAAALFPQVRFYARRFGNTKVPLRLIDVTTGLSTVSITVAEFDALPEIVDGWREVNLRFATAPTFATAAGDVDWRWDAVGETAGNQWQVLGADGPSTTIHSIAPATYYAPQGDTVTLTWQSPAISGTANDVLSDAVLIFSQDPPAVTGFAVATTSQPITGIGQNCGINPRCIPTAIYGNRVTWTSFGVCDSFDDRVSVNGWNTADTDQVWENSIPDSEYFVINDVGVHSHTSVNTLHNSRIETGRTDNLVHADLRVPFMPTGADVSLRVSGRFIDTSNHYWAQLQISTAGVATLSIQRRVAGVAAAVTGNIVLTEVHTTNAIWNIELELFGTRLRARAWRLGSPIPTWQREGTDANLVTGTKAGVITRLETGNTNTLPAEIYTDNFSATHLALVDGSIELQRRDALTDWQTILNAVSYPCVSRFDDFEARVGQLSEYRIRTLNVLDFAGPWATGSGTIPVPGVVVNGTGNSVLIFTSNRQPTSNLAYTMTWEGQAIETFAFPEADEVQLQRMFGKDFFTAFHPLERGGDQFTRSLIVNAAAIALPSLANFQGLRDLAWASLNYVCVRDELGNRWYANVRVPDGAVRLDRTIYVAQIQVSEVTDTPEPVDPGGAS